jgi:multidrug efflux pump subunit AcrA (membrane-fusion protein)
LGVIEKSLDPVTHLATAWVDLPMDTSQIASLLPGMTGQVKIGAQSTAARLSIPKSALVRDGAERFVLVEQERNAKALVFRKIPLAIGEQSGGVCEVTRGELVPGDRVLTQGSRQLGHLFTQGVLKLSPEAAVDIGFKTQKVEPLRVSRTLSVDGVVSLPPSKLARVSSQLSGRVHQILIDRSATVRQGQALALLSSPEFQDLQLDCIQANLEMRFRESVLRNIRQGGTSIPQRQRIETENQLVSARNQFESLARQLRLLGIGQEELESMLESQQVSEHYRVLAPIDGIVVGFHPR